MEKILASMPANDPLVLLFHGAKTTGNVPHALLFSSSVWSGQELWATYLASELLKNDMNGEENPFRSMDMHFVEDAGELVTALETRALRDALQMTPRGRRHVVLFPRMERLLSMNTNHESANTLLKVIEEPPTETVFLFTTESEFSLLPTLLSRVYKVPCPMISESLARDILQCDSALWEESRGKLSLLLFLKNETFREKWKKMKERMPAFLNPAMSITEKVRLVSDFLLSTKENEKKMTKKIGEEITPKDLFFYHFELSLEESLKTGMMDISHAQQSYQALATYRKHLKMNINKKLALYHFLISLFPPY